MKINYNKFKHMSLLIPLIIAFAFLIYFTQVIELSEQRSIDSMLEAYANTVDGLRSQTLFDGSGFIKDFPEDWAMSRYYQNVIENFDERDIIYSVIIDTSNYTIITNRPKHSQTINFNPLSDETFKDLIERERKEDIGNYITSTLPNGNQIKLYYRLIDPQLNWVAVVGVVKDGSFQPNGSMILMAVILVSITTIIDLVTIYFIVNSVWYEKVREDKIRQLTAYLTSLIKSF